MTNARQAIVRKFVAQAFAAGSFDDEVEVIERAHVIPSRGKGPRPKVAYATLLLVTDERSGYPARAVVGADTTARTVTTGSLQYRIADFSLQFYYEGAIDRAHRFVQWAESEEGLNAGEELTNDADVAFPIRVQHPLQILQTFAGVGDHFEDRAYLRLPILYAETTYQTTDWIDEGRRGDLRRRQAGARPAGGDAMMGRAGLEPATCGFESRRSIP